MVLSKNVLLSLEQVKQFLSKAPEHVKQVASHAVHALVVSKNYESRHLVQLFGVLPLHSAQL